jgi:hypothetical protein
LRGSIERPEVVIKEGGILYALSPTPRPKAADQHTALLAAGFEKLEQPEFQLFPGEINRVSGYQKAVKAGDRLAFKKLVVFVAGEGCVLAAP